MYPLLIFSLIWSQPLANAPLLYSSYEAITITANAFAPQISASFLPNSAAHAASQGSVTQSEERAVRHLPRRELTDRRPALAHVERENCLFGVFFLAFILYNKIYFICGPDDRSTEGTKEASIGVFVKQPVYRGGALFQLGAGLHVKRRS